MLLSSPSERFALAASCTRLARLCREARIAPDQVVDMIYPRTLDDDEATFVQLPRAFPLTHFPHVYGEALKVFRVSPSVEASVVKNLLIAIVKWSPKLETLSFRDCGNLGVPLIDDIAKLQQLDTLEVSNPSEAIYTALSSNFHSLQNLFFHHVSLSQVSRLRSLLDRRPRIIFGDVNQLLTSFYMSIRMPVSESSGEGEDGLKVRNDLLEVSNTFRLLHEYHHILHMSIVFDYAPESEHVIETCFYDALGSTRLHFTKFYAFSTPPSQQRSIISKNATHLDLLRCSQYIYDFSRVVRSAHDLFRNSVNDQVIRNASTLMMNDFSRLNDFMLLPGRWQVGCFEFLRHSMPKLSMLKIGQFRSDDNLLVLREWDVVNNSVGLALQVLDQIIAVEIPWAFLSSFKFHSKASYMSSWRNIREVHLSSLYYSMGLAYRHIPDACALTGICNFFVAISENCPRLQVINLQRSACLTCNCINKITFRRQNTWEVTVGALRRVYYVLDHIEDRYSHHVDVETVRAQLLEWEHLLEFAKPQSEESLYRLMEDV